MRRRGKVKKTVIAKLLINIVLIICCVLFVAIGSANKANASGSILPTAEDNLNIGLRSKSYLVATGSGYMRVFNDDKKIGIEYYDSSFNILRKKSINMELEIFGGFYAGANAYYIVEGQTNTEQSNTAEVIRVTKYDTNWNKKGTAKITGDPDLFGGQVRYPFDYGCVEMTEKDGTLYIVTGHEGYVDPNYNQGHQGFLMIAVNEANMTGKIVDCDLWHSFAQYIKCDTNNLYVLEQSEGSRITKLTKYDADSLSNSYIPVLRYGGVRDSAYAIACYASVDGMALSANNILCIGTSIDQSDYDSITSDTAHNIYLTITPKSDFTEEATTVKWLTNYSGDGHSFLGVKLVKINDNRFLVMWEEYGQSQTASVNDCLSSSVLHYVFIDGNGNALSKSYTAAASISDCNPIVNGTKVVYYASSGNMVDFYSIDTSTGAFTKKVYRIAGENATWKISNRVLKVTGTGALSIDGEAHLRYPLSSTSRMFSYSTTDNAWKDVRDKADKVIIGKGITSISDNAFSGFGMKEVVIEPGLKSIGKEAFYCCSNLEQITIPASVTSIGEDFLWTGYYWMGGDHLTEAVIYAPAGSYAVKYAKKNNIQYQIVLTEDNVSISGINSRYAYNGKEICPKPIVKMNGKTLAYDQDYIVIHENNKKIGTAKIRIIGNRNYTGTIEKTFSIVPKKATITKLSSTKKGTIKVSWKRSSNATGYQIQYARNSKFTKNKKTITVSKRTTTSKTIKKLSTNKRYYVRVRAYKKVGSKKYYGAWSKVSMIKCK